jgi:hypothetical protein
MEAVKIRCPNAACGRQLSVPLDPQAPPKKCRCPACRTVFALSLAPKPARPAAPADEDEGGCYGFAAETNLNYLLRREQDGHRLTPEETAAKQRLLADGRAKNPLKCPACEADLRRGAVICVGCGLNFETGRRLKTRVQAAPVRAAGEAASVLGGLTEIVVTILDNS